MTGVPNMIVLMTHETTSASLLVHDINSRNLPNGIIGKDYAYASHTSSESSKSLDFKSN